MAEDKNTGGDSKANYFQLIGRCYYTINEFDKAASYFLKSLQLWEKQYQKYDDEDYCLPICALHLDIARCYRDLNSPEKAVHQLNKYQESFEALAKSHYSKSSMLDICKELGKLYQDLHAYEKSYEYFNKGLKEVGPETTEWTVAFLNDGCGNCLKKLRNHSAACKYTEAALDIYSKLLKNDEDNPKLLKKVGFCYFRLKSYGKAAVILEKYVYVSDMSGRLLSWFDKIGTANVLKMIAICKSNEKKWSEALYYSRLALRRYESLPKNAKHDLEIAMLYNDIGKRLMCFDELKEAETCFEKAIEVFESISQTARVCSQLALALTNYGDFFERVRAKSKALEYYHKARCILLELSDSDRNNNDLAFLTEKIGHIQRFLGESLRAIDSFKESLVLFELLRGYDKKRAYLLKHIGLCYQKLDYHEESVNYFLKSNSIFESLPFCDAEIGMNLKQVGDLFHTRRMYRDAQSYYRQALDSYYKLPHLRNFERDIHFIQNRLRSRSYQNLSSNFYN